MIILKVKLDRNERLDNLGDNYYIIQNTNYFLFGIDAVLLADFASKYIKKKSKIAEVGSASGIIPLLVNKRAQFQQYNGFEIQEELVNLAKRNIEINKINQRITIECKDIRNYKDFPQNFYNLVIANPPYFPNKLSGSSKRTTITPNEMKRIARNEVTLNLEDLFQFSKWVLKQGGRLVMIYRPERISELIVKAKENSLEPKTIRFIYSTINKDAILVLIELSKRGNPGVKIQKPLIIYEDQKFSKEINKIYEGISRIETMKEGKDGINF